jgi:uncharacterized protein (TIGR02001 family)
MKTISWLLNRQVLSALCAAPILLSATAYADEMPAPEAAPAVAAAAEAPKEPVPDWTYTFNVGLYSEYIFRGVSLSDGPAVQGGFDIAHSSGFYAGTWWSNLDPYYNGKVDAAPPEPARKGNHLESDWYAGYAHTFENGIGVNFLGNYYAYLEGRNIGTGKTKDTENSFEASVAVSYKFLTYTYYRVLTDYYGADNRNGRDGDTKGADYNELKINYTLPIADLNFMTKVGYQNVRHVDADQGDFAIGLNRNFSIPSAGKPIEGFNAGAYYTRTFAVANESFYTTFSRDARDVNQDTIWFYVKRTW